MNASENSSKPIFLQKYFALISKNQNGVILLLAIFVISLFSYLVFTNYIVPAFFFTTTSDLSSDEEQEAQFIAEKCLMSQNTERCFAENFAILTSKKNMTHAVGTLTELQRIDLAARGCHLIAHSISTAELEKDPSKWEELLANVSLDMCSGGFLHGVLEARQRYDESFVVNSTTIPQICEKVRKYTHQTNDSNCSHILGHLVMVTELGNIENAVNVCSQIPEAMQFECYSGVFMENETRENLVAHSVAKRIPWNESTINDQKQICLRYSGYASSACWVELAHMFAFVENNIALSVYDRCSEAPTENIRKQCYQHAVGIMSSSSHFDISQMGTLCQPYEKADEEFRVCYAMAINSMLASSTHNMDRVIGLCNSVPEENKEDCYAMVGKRLSMVVRKNDTTDYCAALPLLYQHKCYVFFEQKR